MTDTDTNPETATGGLDENAWEETLNADLRANGGRPSQGPLKGHGQAAPTDLPFVTTSGVQQCGPAGPGG